VAGVRCWRHLQHSEHLIDQLRRADVDNDRVISIRDLTKIGAHFTQTAPPASARCDQDDGDKIKHHTKGDEACVSHR
jgi:hypothetical protein